MIIPGGPLLLLAGLAQGTAADSLRLLAGRATETALVAEARSRPLVLREAVSDLMTRSVNGPASARDDELTGARRLAEAYGVAWRDPFLVREVARFTAWPLEQRAAKVRADSLRRAGVTAFSRDGPAAAMGLWRRAAVRAAAVPDSAGLAAALGNLGAGFLREEQADSAERYLERSRQLALRIGDVRVAANALGELAGVSEERGDLAQARDRYTQTIALRERIGDSRGLASAYNNLGLLALDAGDLEGARRQLEAALVLNRRDRREAEAATNLLNLAGVASTDGNFGRAEALYRDALATWRSQGRWADAADGYVGLGQLELRRGDYPAARAALVEAVAILGRTGPLAAALDARRELAAALAALGDLQSALDELRGAQRQADSARVSAGLRAGLALARADLAVQLNLLAEAERLYLESERLYRQEPDQDGVVEARGGRAELLIERDDYVGARTLLAGALRAELARGDQRAAALTRLSLGIVARLAGDTVVARRHLSHAATELDRLSDPVAAAAVLGEFAAFEAEVGAAAAADSLYRAALARLDGRVAPDIAARNHAGLALVLRARGSLDAAARELRLAIAELERPGRSLATAERRAAFLADKWDIYAQLALTEQARGRAGAAFEASERLRSRELLEELARGRVGAPADAGGVLVAREQDLRRRVGELEREVEDAAWGDQSRRGPDLSRAGGPAHEALLRAQDAYAELLLEVKELAPRHAELLTPEAASWSDVARRLAPGEVFIEYLVSDSASLAFVVTADTLAAVDLGITRQLLARQVEFVRGTLDPERRAPDDMLWRAPLRTLHRHLVAPVEETGLLAGKTRLVLAPHAELHYLPFAALLGGNRRDLFLVERYELATTPSASVWLALGDRRRQGGAQGTLALAPLPQQLPATRREVEAIERRAAGDARVLSGGQASEASFRLQAPERRVLHLATYGVLNRHNPLFSYVELAAGDGHDGRLEVHEVLGMRLAADLVVLSACQTGLSSGRLADVPAGDDWVGLTRAFLHAGAGQVAATLWPVEDWATSGLMDRFYEAYAAGDDPARALAVAQRGMLAERATAHPFQWAGFVVVGGAR